MGETTHTLKVPEFKTYEEEVTFWDNLDTVDFMEDDGEWFHFETETTSARIKKGTNERTVFT